MKTQKEKYKLLFILFQVNFSISMFTFGGGYVVLPMLQKHFVEKRKIIKEKQLYDIAAIAQSAPGAIAVNMSSLTGYSIAKIPGAVVSCLGAILPPLLLLSIISYYYDIFRSNSIISTALLGMQAGAAAVITDFVVTTIQTIYRQKNWILTTLVFFSFISNFFLDWNVLLILVLGVFIYILIPILQKKVRKIKK